jgi:hypothetical protein
VTVTINEFRLQKLVGRGGEVERAVVPSAEKVRLACLRAAQNVLPNFNPELFVESVEVRVGPRGGVYFEIATRDDGFVRSTHKGQSLQRYMSEKADREGENSWLFKGLREVFPGVRRDRTRIPS